jgi:hypothetical protein
MIGTVGMIQTIAAAAGLHRNPSSLGIHLKPDTDNVKEGFIYPNSGEGTMSVLMRVERRLPGVGASLLDQFFPKGLSEGEKLWWKEMEENRKARKEREEGEQTFLN